MVAIWKFDEEKIIIPYQFPCNVTTKEGHELVLFIALWKLLMKWN